METTSEKTTDTVQAEEEEEESQVTTGKYDLPPSQRLHLEKITDFGELTDVPGTDPSLNLKYHPYAKSDGGFLMADTDRVLPSAMKEITRKVTQNLLKG